MDEARLRKIERRMIRMMRGVRLVDRSSTDVLFDRLGVVKIEDMIIQSRMRWCGHVMRGGTNSQMREVVEVEITGKRKKSRPMKLWEEWVKKDLERLLTKEDPYDRKIWREVVRANIANAGQPV